MLRWLSKQNQHCKNKITEREKQQIYSKTMFDFTVKIEADCYEITKLKVFTYFLLWSQLLQFLFKLFLVGCMFLFSFSETLKTELFITDWQTTL